MKKHKTIIFSSILLILVTVIIAIVGFSLHQTKPSQEIVSIELSNTPHSEIGTTTDEPIPETTDEDTATDDRISCEIINDGFSLSSVTACETGCYLRLAVTLDKLEELKRQSPDGGVVLDIDKQNELSNYNIELTPEAVNELIEIFHTYNCKSINVVKELDGDMTDWQVEVPKGSYCVTTFISFEDIGHMLQLLVENKTDCLYLYRRLIPGVDRIAEIPFHVDDLYRAYYSLQVIDQPYIGVTTVVTPVTTPPRDL